MIQDALGVHNDDLCFCVLKYAGKAGCNEERRGELGAHIEAQLYSSDLTGCLRCRFRKTRYETCM